MNLTQRFPRKEFRVFIRVTRVDRFSDQRLKTIHARHTKKHESKLSRIEIEPTLKASLVNTSCTG